jgi:restriction system protein
MARYKRIRLGKQALHLDLCRSEGFAGLDYSLDEDLTGQFGNQGWKSFNDHFIPIWQSYNPGKSRISAGLACGALWSLCHDMSENDIIFAPNPEGDFCIGRVTGPYFYEPKGPLPHRRPVEWTGQIISKIDMSEDFQRSTKGPLSNIDIDRYKNEIEMILNGTSRPQLIAANSDIEDPLVFGLEKHLEDFLVANWASTEFGKTHRLWEEDGEIVGQQFPSDTGPMDLLAISNDDKEILVIELKKGKASDVVVGQIQRYMGYVIEALADEGQSVRGAIVALNDDLRLRRALSVANNIDFYRYSVSFEMKKQDSSQK